MPLRITRTDVFMAAAPIILFLIVLELVRRKRLREDYSLLWLGTFGVLLILSLWRGFLDHIANLLGIFYPPTALFVIGFALLLIVMIQFSVVISQLASQNKKTAQHIALLTAKLEVLEGRIAELEQD